MSKVKFLSKNAYGLEGALASPDRVVKAEAVSVPAATNQSIKITNYSEGVVDKLVDIDTSKDIGYIFMDKGADGVPRPLARTANERVIVPKGYHLHLLEAGGSAANNVDYSISIWNLANGLYERGKLTINHHDVGTTITESKGDSGPIYNVHVGRNVNTVAFNIGFTKSPLADLALTVGNRVAGATFNAGSGSINNGDSIGTISAGTAVNPRAFACTYQFPNNHPVGDDSTLRIDFTGGGSVLYENKANTTSTGGGRMTINFRKVA